MRKSLKYLALMLLVMTLVWSCDEDENISEPEKEMPTEGLVAYYSFNGDADDQSDSSNHAINFGAELTVDRFGNENSAYDFDGLSDYMRLTKDIDSRSGLTFAFWLSSRGAQDGENNGTIISKYNMTYPDVRNFHIGTFGDFENNTDNMIKAMFYAYNDATSYNDRVVSNWTSETLPVGYNVGYWSFVNPQDLELNVWSFVVVNMTSTELEVWIDGVLTVKKTREYETYAYSSSEPIFIGNLPNGGAGSNNHFNGVLDDIRIYNRALTETEINALYHENGWDE